MRVFYRQEKFLFRQNAHGMVLPIVPGRLLQYELSPWLHQKSIHYSLQPDWTNALLEPKLRPRAWAPVDLIHNWENCTP